MADSFVMLSGKQIPLTKHGGLMGRDVHLNVLLPKNRDHPGRIRVEVNGVPKAEFYILGRGSTTVRDRVTGVRRSTGNPTLNPFMYAGNTPTGNYDSPGVVSTKDWDQSSYGPWGAVELTAISGDALLAESVFGRSGFLIHGGSPGSYDNLNPTLGCLRMSNDNMRQLMQLIADAGKEDLSDNLAVSCEEASVRVSVRE